MTLPSVLFLRLHGQAWEVCVACGRRKCTDHVCSELTAAGEVARRAMCVTCLSCPGCASYQPCGLEWILGSLGLCCHPGHGDAAGRGWLQNRWEPMCSLLLLWESLAREWWCLWWPGRRCWERVKEEAMEGPLVLER